MDSINGCYIGCYNCILQDGKETVGLKPTAHREEDRHMSGRLAGKVAVITGAGSGIGAAMAGMFCREGARVVAADISGQQTEVAATIGGQCIPFQVRSEEHTSESVTNAHLVCRLLLEKKKHRSTYIMQRYDVTQHTLT